MNPDFYKGSLEQAAADIAGEKARSGN